MNFVGNYNIETHTYDINRCRFNDKNDTNYSYGVSTLENPAISKYNGKNNELHKGPDYFDCYDDNYSHINIDTTMNHNSNHIHLKSILNLSQQNCNSPSSCHIHIQTPGLFIKHHHNKSIRKTPMPKECLFDNTAVDCWETYFNNINTNKNRENDKFKLKIGQSSVLKRRNLHK